MLVSVKVNGKALADTDYKLTAKKLILGGLPNGGGFMLEIETCVKPQVLIWSSYNLFLLGEQFSLLCTQ